MPLSIAYVMLINRLVDRASFAIVNMDGVAQPIGDLSEAHESGTYRLAVITNDGTVVATYSGSYNLTAGVPFWIDKSRMRIGCFTPQTRSAA